MIKDVKIGILRETKKPLDRRVALSPGKAQGLLHRYPHVQVLVQPSPTRCYPDHEYDSKGITLQEDLSGCDYLLGVKEVDPESLLPGKTYLFFSHTAKKQSGNRRLLQEALRRGITLIDYEYLTDLDGKRLVAFGHWAGVVGAYNGLYALGLREKAYELPRAHSLLDVKQMYEALERIDLPKTKIVITGGGRVAHGAMEVLVSMDIEKVSPQEFLSREFDKTVFTQLDPWHYVEREDGKMFDSQHFYKHPDQYQSRFLPYAKAADMLITGHYWDPRSPEFFTREQMLEPGFRLKVIADVSCDLDGPIPSTLRPASIAEPLYGYSPQTGAETAPFEPGSVTVMAVDNLPGEAPRSSSIDFGAGLVERVFPSLLLRDIDGVIDRATIAHQGELAPAFAYLRGFAEGDE